MNELQIFRNNNFGEIRTLEKNGKILFCGSDVAKALGFKDTVNALKQRCKKDGVAFHHITDSLGRQQQAKFIDEGNLYRLIVSSKLPSAEKFERWVFDEVLPSIRKTGGYGTQFITKKDLQEIITQTATAVVNALNNQNNTPTNFSKWNIPRRGNGKIDRLPTHLKISVEQMLLAGMSYREIVDFLADNNEYMSQMAVCNYAKKYFTTLSMVNENNYRWQSMNPNHYY